MIPLDQLAAYVAAMRELGVTRLGPDSIELGPAPKSAPSPAINKPSISKAEWEERLLFAATEGFPTEPEPTGDPQ